VEKEFHQEITTGYFNILMVSERWDEEGIINHMKKNVRSLKKKLEHEINV